jgi:hypothetical protein
MSKRAQSGQETAAQAYKRPRRAQGVSEDGVCQVCASHGVHHVIDGSMVGPGGGAVQQCTNFWNTLAGAQGGPAQQQRNRRHRAVGQPGEETSLSGFASIFVPTDETVLRSAPALEHIASLLRIYDACAEGCDREDEAQSWSQIARAMDACEWYEDMEKLMKANLDVKGNESSKSRYAASLKRFLAFLMMTDMNGVLWGKLCNVAFNSYATCAHA